MRHISMNKHEHNVRMFDVLEETIAILDAKKRNPILTKREKRNLKKEIKGLIRLQHMHGKEILQYEENNREIR